MCTCDCTYHVRGDGFFCTLAEEDMLHADQFLILRFVWLDDEFKSLLQISAASDYSRKTVATEVEFSK